MHKMLGVTCLLHFVCRFVWCGSSDMRFGATRQTLGAIALHALLSASSLIFRIPIKRIAEGSRIWPEYRLHSITFAYRSLLCMLVTWYEAQAAAAAPAAAPPPPRYEANALIVLLTLAVADFGTWCVGREHGA